MTEAFYDRINDYGSVKISLASPNDIRSWSYGEVKKPETINYRTYRAEKDGLFCERIFGPERDWECFCGKYKGMKHKGVICDRCGVKVTHSRVRRKRMGHINLAVPVVHIWFFKSIPSRMSALLSMKTTSLERVIYYQDYVVIDPGDTPLKECQLLTEDEFRRARESFGATFKADMGAEAIGALIRRIDLNELAVKLREDLKATSSKQRTKDITKRLKLVEALRDSDNQPEWMVMDVIPVIPPDLRPLVLLESGNFATSDLNDLYRRIINRNNRLKKLIELNAPEVIIRNEKRMLQQAVDSLFDNNRCKRPVLGSSNRPLKSLTDMIKGKQGRFRENLLGKRVDYSARSVIVVGPELKLHQCGLPKKIALELFQPFIIRRLKERGLADTIKSAKKMLERKDDEVWDVLEDVIHHHPVMLNRAPTLHRMGIQAFEPVLVEGNAIRIHPLVCKGFNADFDGDQMAVHLPLSIEAQVESYSLMLSTNNIFSPANGLPIITPSQDIVLGIYYLTTAKAGQKREDWRFANQHEALMAYDEGKIGMHTFIWVRLPADREVVDDPEEKPSDPKGRERFEKAHRAGIVRTTVGRIILNDALDPAMPFYNKLLNQKGVSQVISDCHRLLDRRATIKLLDDIKHLGFKHATLAGLSFSAEDMKVPPKKDSIIKATQREVERVQRMYTRGVITEGERYNQIIDLWTHAREVIGDALMEVLRGDVGADDSYMNPIFLMVDSGARGSVDQVRQLAGIRGLMAKPSGEIIETPILSNFREGLGVLEYFSSTHGGRKGLADTALKTADSGYLTRKIADVAQNVVVNEMDCGTGNGVSKQTIYKADQIDVSISKLITGRVARDTIADIISDEVIVAENELITEDKAGRIEELGYEKVRVRSPLTCESPVGVCAKCYGMDLSTGSLVEEGMAVGIIAAQSIGEPGTQLTMRTFHIGGTASRALEESEIRVQNTGVVRYRNLRVVEDEEGQSVVVSRNGDVLIVDAKERELERHRVPAGAHMFKLEGEKVEKGRFIVRWNPHMIPIVVEMAGTVRFEDISEGETMREEVDSATGIARKVIIDHKGDKHPQIIIEDSAGKPLGVYPLPERAIVEVDEGQQIGAGVMLAKTAREISGTQDITGGLPRVSELLEARKPKEPSVLAQVDGIVELGERKRGRLTILVRNEETDIVKEHTVPRGKHLLVHSGDHVKAGDPLVEGPWVLQDILDIKGQGALENYLLREVQNVYRSQKQTIDDKHIEVIIRQMLLRVRIEDPGDTPLLPYAIVDRFRFHRVNEEVVATGGSAARATPLLMGITKAGLRSDSFLSAASFQETTRVLTEAALAGRVDRLLGLKENVILGHLVPAGTGFKAYGGGSLKKAVPELEHREEIDPFEEDKLPA